MKNQFWFEEDQLCLKNKFKNKAEVINFIKKNNKVNLMQIKVDFANQHFLNFIVTINLIL